MTGPAGSRDTKSSIASRGSGRDALAEEDEIIINISEASPPATRSIKDLDRLNDDGRDVLKAAAAD